MMEGYPIRAVARRTGLSPHAIRAWERRYGAVHPSRTPTGRRLYSAEDLERLVLLRRATLAGRSIGQIATLPTETLRRLVEEDERAAGPLGPIARRSGEDEKEAGPHLAASLEAVRALDAPALERVLERARLALGRTALMDFVLVPLMGSIGDAWRQGSLRIAHEHLASAVVRTVAGTFEGPFAAGTDGAPEIVVTTPSGQLHELGALLAAATAVSEGWHATYLGPSLPADEIAAAARARRARAVALSLVYPADDPRLASELATLARLLDGASAVIAGGAAAASYRPALEAIGAEILPDYAALRETLESLRRGRPEGGALR